MDGKTLLIAVLSFIFGFALSEGLYIAKKPDPKKLRGLDK